MLYIASMLRLGEAPALPCPLDDDSKDRMMVCLNALARPDDEMVQVSCLLLLIFCCCDVMPLLCVLLWMMSCLNVWACMGVHQQSNAVTSLCLGRLSDYDSKLLLTFVL